MNKTPLKSYANEREQRRATVSSRFVTSAQFLSDEKIAFLVRNENHERILELLTTAVFLGSDQVVAIKSITQPASLTMRIPSELAAQEEAFFRAEYDIKADFSELVIPVPPVGYKALFLAMHEKVSQAPEFLFQSDKTAYGGKVWKYTETSLDEAVPIHRLTGTFGVWVPDGQEAADGCIGRINLSTNAVDELDKIAPGTWAMETLPIRQVHGRKFFRMNSKHLDTKVITLCSGSRAAGGGVPSVRLGDDGSVGVSCWRPGFADDFIRFRRAVSL